MSKVDELRKLSLDNPACDFLEIYINDEALLAGLQPGLDEAALFSFDTELTELQPFSTTFDFADKAWASTRAYGATSLWDAIGTT